MYVCMYVCMYVRMVLGRNYISRRFLACARLAQCGAAEPSAEVFEGMDSAGHHDTRKPRPGTIPIHTYPYIYIHIHTVHIVHTVHPYISYLFFKYS